MKTAFCLQAGRTVAEQASNYFTSNNLTEQEPIDSSFYILLAVTVA